MWSRFLSSTTDCVVVRHIIHYRFLFSGYKLCEAGSFSLLQTVWLSDRLFITGPFFPAKNYVKQVLFLCYRLCGCQTDYSLQVPFFLLQTMWSRFLFSATDCVVVKEIIPYLKSSWSFSLVQSHWLGLCKAGTFSLLQTMRSFSSATD